MDEDTAVSRDIHLELADLAREMHGRSSASLDSVLEHTTHAALSLVSGAQHVGITLIAGRREITSVAPTDGYARQLDAIQQRYREGPCLSSAWRHHMIRTDDYAAEERWPQFIAAAMSETPVRSSLCFQLFTQNQVLGALNVHADERETFTDEAEEIGMILATHAAIALGTARRDSQFRSALGTRDVIGQAKGILMERHKISATDAFRLLVKLSQDTNTPVSAVAEEFVNGIVPQRSHAGAAEVE